MQIPVHSSIIHACCFPLTHTPNNSKCPAQNWRTAMFHTSSSFSKIYKPRSGCFCCYSFIQIFFSPSLIVLSLCISLYTQYTASQKYCRIKRDYVRSQVLRLAGPQYRVMCGSSPTREACGFEEMKESRLWKHAVMSSTNWKEKICVFPRLDSNVHAQ